MSADTISPSHSLLWGLSLGPILQTGALQGDSFQEIILRGHFRRQVKTSYHAAAMVEFSLFELVGLGDVSKTCFRGKRLGWGICSPVLFLLMIGGIVIISTGYSE